MGRGTWLNWSKQHPQLQTKGFNYKYSKYTKTLLHHIWDPVQGEKRRRRQIDDRTDVVWIRKCISLKLRQFSLKLLHRSTIEFWATSYWTPPLPWTVNTNPPDYLLRVLNLYFGINYTIQTWLQFTPQQALLAWFTPQLLFQTAPNQEKMSFWAVGIFMKVKNNGPLLSRFWSFNIKEVNRFVRKA